MSRRNKTEDPPEPGPGGSDHTCVASYRNQGGPLLLRVGPPRVRIGPRIAVHVSVTPRVAPRVSVRVGSRIPVHVSVTSRVPPRVSVNVAPRVRVSVSPPVTFRFHVGVQGIRLVEVLLGVGPEVLRLRLPPLCLLPEPRRLNLGLLSISFGPHGLGFIFTGLKLRLLSFTPDFGRLLTVLFIALLPKCFPALAAHEQNNQRDGDDYNDDPNPGSCLHRGSTSLPFQHRPVFARPAYIT